MKLKFFLATLMAICSIVLAGTEVKTDYLIKDISKSDDDLSVAHGRLVNSEVYETINLFSKAVYELSAIARGPLKGNHVKVHFHASSLHNPLPEEIGRASCRERV